MCTKSSKLNSKKELLGAWECAVKSKKRLLLETIGRWNPKPNALRFVIMLLTAWMAVFASPCLASERVFCVTNSPYNAFPNDNLDDTDAIQAALDDAAAVFDEEDSAGRSGVVVVFPKGLYEVSSRLHFITTNYPPEGGGIMIRGESRSNTTIHSSGTDGALLLQINVANATTDHIHVQFEDIGFKAAIENAGPAIEIAPYMADGTTLADDNLHVIPTLCNVRIARTALANYYSCGIKGNNLRSPTIDDVIIMGRKNYMETGIGFEKTYSHKIKDCTIDGAKVGVHHYIGGEGNFFKRVTITNATTGIKIENVSGRVYVSDNGGTILHSSISASECGISLDLKSFVFIADNDFNMMPGGTTYMDVQLKDCNQCSVVGNRFNGVDSAVRTGVSLVPGTAGNYALRSEENMVSDNIFSSTQGTGVSVAAGVKRTMVFNNQFNMATTFVDNGENSRFVDGAPEPFVSPAEGLRTSEGFNWEDVTGTVFNVKDFYAAGDGLTDDTVKIQEAADAVAGYLHENASNEAVLYFPAGTYILKDQISMAPDVGHRLTILGDGMRVSVIERSLGGDKGVFKLDFPSNEIRADIQNLMLVATYADAGDAIYIAQPSAPGVSSAQNLYMRNVLLERKSNTQYFSNALNGRYVAMPFFENVSIAMYKKADDRLEETTGIRLEDSWGFECDDVGIGVGLGKGLYIKSLGGNVLIRNGSVVGPSAGMQIDAGGGLVALEASHINAKFNLDVSNAVGVSWVNSQTLSNNNSYPEASQSAIHLADCSDVEIRNVAFSKSFDLFNNPDRRSIWLDGTGNSNVEIYGNLFLEPGERHVYTQTGSAGPKVRYNFFGRTDVDDMEGPTSQIDRLYHLNGKPGEYYLLKNKQTGKYLRVKEDGVSLACDSTVVDDASMWKISYDKLSSWYTLESKAEEPIRVKRNSDNSLVCEGLDSAPERKWYIVNRQNGYYTLKNDNPVPRYMQSYGVDGVDCSGDVVSIQDNEKWQIITAEDLVIGMDKMTMNASNATGNAWTTVNFIKPFPQPPAVFMGGPSGNETDPITVRVRNVTTSGFEFQLDEWDYLDGIHGEEEISFIAVHKGSYKVENLGTRSIEAGTVEGVDTNWVTKTFKVPFSTVPCVFAQCTSVNDASAVCTRVRAVTPSTFQVRLQEQWDGGGEHVGESVDFIAIDPGPNQYFEVGITNSFADHNWTALTFSSDQWTLPGFVGSVQSSGGDHPCILRYKELSDGAVSVKVDEDGSNGETIHGKENVGWMVFGNIQ